MELEAGAAKATGTTVEAALERYFDDHVQLRPGTVRIYQHTADKFATWAKAQRIKGADDVTGAKLVAFRAAESTTSTSRAGFLARLGRWKPRCKSRRNSSG